MKKLSINRLGSRRGNALVEFALASLILIPMYFGAFQFGYTFYVYNLLCSQIRAAARYGSIRTFNAGSNSSITAFSTAVKNVVIKGNPDGSGTVIEPGITAANLEVLLLGTNGNAASATNVPTTLTVRTASGANAYQVDAVVTKFTFTGKPYLTIPYTGQFAPAGTE
jgi:Flp pilus assembly protein TadG